MRDADAFFREVEKAWRASASRSAVIAASED
jgi:hypothetical protein